VRRKKFWGDSDSRHQLEEAGYFVVALDEISIRKRHRADQVITGTFLVQHKDVRQKKSGEPYLSLTLADRTGDLDAKMSTMQPKWWMSSNGTTSSESKGCSRFFRTARSSRFTS